MSDNPYRTPDEFGIPEPLDQALHSRQTALSKVTPAAIGLIVTGVINILGSLWGLANSIMFMMGVGPAVAAQEQQREQMEQLKDQGVDMSQFMEIMSIFQGPVGIAISVVQLIAAGFIIFGAIKMKNMQSYGLSLAAAIVAMIPMLSNCCCIGLPIGIWGIVVLMDENVKRNFPIS